MRDIIKMPDGTRVDMTGAPPEAHEALKRKIREMLPDQSLWGSLKRGGTDLLRGAAQALSGPADTAAFAAGFTDKSPWGGEAPVQSFVKEQLPEPKDGGSYTRAILQGIGGAAVTGPKSLINYAAGAGGGAGAEVGQRVGGTPGALVGGLVGGLAAGGGVSTARAARPQSANLAREALEGITPEALAKAATYQAKVKAAGHSIDLAQALQATNSGSGNLEAIRNALASRSQGNEVQKVLRGQPQSLATEAELTARDLPGVNYSPEQNAANTQQTATQAIKQATDSRSAQVKDLYAKAGDLPPEARGELIDLIQGMLNKPGASEVLKAKGQEIIKKLSGQDDQLTNAVAAARAKVEAATSTTERMAARSELAAANTAANSAGAKALKALDVDTWIGELAGPFKGQPLKIAYPKERGQVKGLAGAVNKRFQELSPEVVAAEKRFQQITEETINPLKQGPIGALTQPGGYDPATAAMVSKFDGMMNSGVDPTAKVSSVRTAAKELAKADPDAFESSFKGWVSRKIQKAIPEGTAESPLPSDPKIAENIYESLFKDKLRWQGIKDATAQMAEIRGQKPEEVIRGLEALKTLTVAMKSNPGGVGGMSPADLKRIGGSSATANAVRVMSFLPANRLGEGIERAVLGKTLSQFDAILTQPDGHKMLIELGKVPVMSRKAQTILGTFAGTMGNSPTD